MSLSNQFQLAYVCISPNVIMSQASVNCMSILVDKSFANINSVGVSDLLCFIMIVLCAPDAPSFFSPSEVQSGPCYWLEYIFEDAPYALNVSAVC